MFGAPIQPVRRHITGEQTAPGRSCVPYCKAASHARSQRPARTVTGGGGVSAVFAADDDEHDGPPADPVDALERYGRVYVSSPHSSRGCVHLHPYCRETPSPDGRGRVLTHRGELPLRCDDVCSLCRRYYTDDQGRIRPTTDSGEIVDRPTLTGRVCGCLGCHDDGIVRIEHPEHGTRVVCPLHQRRHPVEEVLGQ